LNNLHPNERQLQRFLNKACTELEYKRIKQHIHVCSSCRARLHAYLNLEELLNELDVLTPRLGLEERVMQAIRTESRDREDAAAGLSINSRNVRDSGKTTSRKLFASPELINGLIATAATYLFVGSGILGKIMSINAGEWEADVQSRFEDISLAVQQISMYFIS
jgi:hypothetical protein